MRQFQNRLTPSKEIIFNSSEKYHYGGTFQMKNSDCRIPGFAGKIIRRECPAGNAVELEIVAPTITSPGEEFSLKAVLLDDKGFPSEGQGEKFTLKIPECKLTLEFSFPAGGLAIAIIGKVKLKKEGIFRFEANFENKPVFSNPCVCRRDAGKRLFWGDPHIHSALSNCMIKYSRSLNFGFNAARYLSCLDWAGVADHVSNGRCGLDKWKEQTAGADAYDEPGSFVTLPAYEASLAGGKGGDNNVYMDKFPSMFIDDYENGSVKTLCEKLEELSRKENFDFFVVPHHTTRTGKHGEIPDDIYPGEKLMPVVEIHSKWGSSEYRGNPFPLKDIHPGPSYVADLLERNLMLGFIAGTDTHATMTFGKPVLEPGHIDRLPGLTAVCAEKLERGEIFHAIKSRNCYAACGERIYLDFKINGIPMGSSIKISSGITPSANIHIECAAKGDLETVEIIRNGQCIRTLRPEAWKFGIDFEDKDLRDIFCKRRICHYYVRVRCKSGASAWASPIWITE